MTEREDGEGGRLVLIGTPLGNREDLSPRALRLMCEADLLLCEDTRSPLRLVAGHEGAVLPRRLSCFQGNEHQRVELMLEALRAGRTVAFVSEAGMPVWSDPGRMLVEAAVEAGFNVDGAPGPTAAALALALSGFPALGSRFMGFAPRSGPDRQRWLAQMSEPGGPCIVYEAGNRVPGLLSDLAEALDDPSRRLLIARELTKRNQELIRGEVAKLAGAQASALRGEVTLVLEGREAEEVQREGPSAAQARARETLEAMLDPTLKPRARARRLADLTGLDAREVYARLARPDES
jgi:16S rRNA (cytidine1402-2'-O)-methyltransferase